MQCFTAPRKQKSKTHRTLHMDMDSEKSTHAHVMQVKDRHAVC